MTPPMTPREKVTRLIDDAPEHQTADELADAILTALASGSGDHAELAKAIERLLPISIHETPDYAEVSFGGCQAQAMTMEPETWLALNQLPALIAENAALRGANYIQSQDMIISDARATEAERKLAEEVGRSDDLLKALEWYGEQARLARLIHSEGDAGRHALADDGGSRARAFIANHETIRINAWLSKEAERG